MLIIGRGGATIGTVESCTPHLFHNFSVLAVLTFSHGHTQANTQTNK